MRTPGNDFELATGFLFTEGIIQKADDIETINHCSESNQNVVRVELRENIPVNISKLEKNFYTTSSFGICGKASIDTIKTVCRINKSTMRDLNFPVEILLTLSDKLRQAQSVLITQVAYMVVRCLMNQVT